MLANGETTGFDDEHEKDQKTRRVISIAGDFETKAPELPENIKGCRIGKTCHKHLVFEANRGGETCVRNPGTIKGPFWYC